MEKGRSLPRLNKVSWIREDSGVSGREVESTCSRFRRRNWYILSRLYVQVQDRARLFKHGKYIESASHPAASTSSSDVPRPIAMNTASTSASDVPRPNAMNTASTSASDAPRPGAKIRTVGGGDRIDLTEPDAKRRRQKHAAEFKADVLQKLAEGMTPNEAMSMYRSFNINKSQISKWSKAKDEINAAAADRQKKKLTKIRPAIKYKDLYREILTVFRETRSRGRHVDFNWIYSQAQKIQCELLDDPEATLKQHVIANFIKRYHLKRRKIQRNKRLAKEHYRKLIEKWHATLRERGIRTGAAQADYDVKWGRYLPHQRLNVDQSPLPFARETTMTYEEIHSRAEGNREKRIWTAQPNTGDSKRFCTLQICFRPEGDQPRIAIIFRGLGLRISAVEKAAWDPDVDVYFQKNAWADTTFSIEWAERTLKPFVSDLDNFILFLDNLTAHVQDRFRETVEELNGLGWFGIPGATDIWQPVDGGYASTLKALIRQKFFNWLDDAENLDKWYGADSHITASEKRILITHWVGKAYRKLTSSRYDSFRWRMFGKTGCLITADASEDGNIQPEGLSGYVMPPPPPLHWTLIPAQQLHQLHQRRKRRKLMTQFTMIFEGDEEGHEAEIVVDDAVAEDGWIFDLYA